MATMHTPHDMMEAFVSGVAAGIVLGFIIVFLLTKHDHHD